LPFCLEKACFCHFGLRDLDIECLPSGKHAPNVRKSLWRLVRKTLKLARFAVSRLRLAGLWLPVV